MTESFRPMAFFVGFMVFWFVLNKWVLPRFGVRT
jgi:hypothetical protein